MRLVSSALTHPVSLPFSLMNCAVFFGRLTLAHTVIFLMREIFFLSPRNWGCAALKKRGGFFGFFIPENTTVCEREKVFVGRMLLDEPNDDTNSIRKTRKELFGGDSDCCSSDSTHKGGSLAFSFSIRRSACQQVRSVPSTRA